MSDTGPGWALRSGVYGLHDDPQWRARLGAGGLADDRDAAGAAESGPH